MKFLIVAIIILTCIFVNCSNEGKVRPLNPNGDSELALLMRQMFEDGMLAKQAVMNDKEIGKLLRHEKILTTSATQPEKVATDLFKTYAQQYLQLVAQINDPKNPNRKEDYESLVNSCMQCHQQICPGPMVKIKKMALDYKSEGE